MGRSRAQQRLGFNVRFLAERQHQHLAPSDGADELSWFRMRVGRPCRRRYRSSLPEYRQANAAIPDAPSNRRIDRPVGAANARNPGEHGLREQAQLAHTRIDVRHEAMPDIAIVRRPWLTLTALVARQGFDARREIGRSIRADGDVLDRSKGMASRGPSAAVLQRILPRLAIRLGQPAALGTGVFSNCCSHRNAMPLPAI